MSKSYRAVNGMHDILPATIAKWSKAESVARAIFSRFGFAEIRTPIVEHAELFVRSVGEATAVVEKEMYTFDDQGDNRLALRPEGTASVLRAYVESGAYSEPMTKYFTMGPMFRRERPQKGRYRQFHQISVEAIGSDHPALDAELMAMTAMFFKELGIDGITLEINTVGDKASREKYIQTLMAFLSKHESSLCNECRRRMIKNPMRVLDCKNPTCGAIYQSAPLIIDYLSDESRAHYEKVKGHLRDLSVPFVENHRIVRGLDYYVGTAFEFTTDQLGSQSAVAAGGRYNGLVKTLGGPDLPGVGFAIGLERCILLMPDDIPSSVEPVIFFAMMGEAAQSAMLPLLHKARQSDLVVEWDYEGRSLKSQMRRADKLQARWVVIVGENEIEKRMATIRDMKTKEQVDVPFETVVTTLKGYL